MSVMKGGRLELSSSTSEDFSMPETSIKTGDVDFILPLDKIAPKLMELVDGCGGLENDRTTTKEGCLRKPDKTCNAMPCSQGESCDNPAQEIAA
jgi:hypothetical protein